MAAFRIFGKTLPIHFALLGRKRKYIKSKTTAKLTEKRTSIAAVRDILWTLGTFPNPLLSRYRLPLIYRVSTAIHIPFQICATAPPANVMGKKSLFHFPTVNLYLRTVFKGADIQLYKWNLMRGKTSRLPASSYPPPHTPNENLNIGSSG